jgi:hypothetical protein
LRLAEEHGAAEAARLTGVPAATIRSWRKRAGVAGPPAGAESADWVARKQAGAEEAWATAQAALGKVRELIDAGKHGDAQRAALTAAILIDKSGVLESAWQTAEDRHARLEHAAAQQLVAVLRVLFDAIEVPLSCVRSLLAELLRQADAGEAITPSSDTANAARAAVREHIARELRADIERDVRQQSDRPTLELPAPEPEPVEPAASEVVTGEIVDEQPSRRPRTVYPPPVVNRRSRPDFSQRSY